jgi:hypothetical protein
MPLHEEPAASAPPWPEIDRRFLFPSRPAPPAFPLELLSDRWGAWIESVAPSLASIDYVTQGLLGAVSAVCGPRTVVEVTPHWREPLVLWLAIVGGGSSGKTPALAAGRRLIEALAAADGNLAPAARSDGSAALLAHAALGQARGVSLWCDDLAGWLAGLTVRQQRLAAVAGWTGDSLTLCDGQRGSMTDVPRFALPIVGTLHADELAEALARPDGGAASRFLYAWPQPGLEVRLTSADAAADEVHVLLHGLARLAGSADAPHALRLDGSAATALESLVPTLRTFLRDLDGLEGLWVGKGAGTIVRLAGLLCLMEWVAAEAAPAPTVVAERHIEQAHALWSGYFWPQAQAVFTLAGTTVVDRQARRVAHWLRRTRVEVASREDVRREALCQSVDAEAAESVIERLERYGVLRPSPIETPVRRGPRKRRWQVNAELWLNWRN